MTRTGGVMLMMLAADSADARTEALIAANHFSEISLGKDFPIMMPSFEISAQPSTPSMARTSSTNFAIRSFNMISAFVTGRQRE